MNNIEFIGVNNPRLENGDFGPETCSRCEQSSTAYAFVGVWANPFVLCKSCLLEAVELIDRTILDDCIKKGRERHGK